MAVGLADLDVFDVPRKLAATRHGHAALEDRLLAINDRHIGQRQLKDDLLERRTEPTHHLDVVVGDLLGCVLCSTMVSSRMMSLNVRPSDDCRRYFSDRHNGEPLDMGQRTGRCRF